MEWEELLMDIANIIAMVIAGLGLLAIIGTVIKEFRDTNQLSKQHEGLSKQHKDILDDHKMLKTEINNHVSDKVSLIKENQNRIEQTVAYLKDSQLRSEGEKRLLTEKALDISKTIDQLSALNDLLIKQCARIQKLERENQALKIQPEHNQEWEEEQEF